jgi:hypothetical protein
MSRSPQLEPSLSGSVASANRCVAVIVVIAAVVVIIVDSWDDDISVDSSRDQPVLPQVLLVCQETHKFLAFNKINAFNEINERFFPMR